MDEVHSQITIFDIRKDAYGILKQPLFIKCINELYGTKPLLNESELENKIKELRKMGFSKIIPNTRFQINVLRFDQDPNLDLLPNSVKYAIHDNGIDPTEYNHNLKIIWNPGSYLDPANRTKQCDIHYHTPLNNTHFSYLGLDAIEYMTPEVSANSSEYSINIKFTFDTQPIKFKFNAVSLNSKNTNTGKYLLGNNCKNNWFRTNTTITNKNVIEGKKYILCKEIGDTLQAYYAYLFIHTRKLDPNSVCLFTSDNIITLRCRLLGVPVITLDHAKYNEGVYESFYFPLPGIITPAMQKLYLSNCLDHNNSVIDHLKKILGGKEVYAKLDASHPLHLHPSVHMFLRKYIQKIEAINSKLKSTDTTYYTIMEYKNLMNKYSAPHLIYINNDTYYLYTTIVKNMYFTTEGKTLLEYLSVQSGGGNTTPFLSPKSFLYATNPNESFENYLPDKQLKRLLFLMFQKTNKSVYDAIMHTESLYNILCHSFNYIGKVFLREDFLVPIVNLYEKKDSMTFQEFSIYAYNWETSLFGSSTIFIGDVDFSDPEKKDNILVKYTLYGIAGGYKTRKRRRFT